jgi:hypothetical protein
MRVTCEAAEGGRDSGSTGKGGVVGGSGGVVGGNSGVVEGSKGSRNAENSGGRLRPFDGTGAWCTARATTSSVGASEGCRDVAECTGSSAGASEY